MLNLGHNKHHGRAMETGDAAELKKLKVVELREELGRRGLPTSGNKAVLIQRLSEVGQR